MDGWWWWWWWWVVADVMLDEENDDDHWWLIILCWNIIAHDRCEPSECVPDQHSVFPNAHYRHFRDCDCLRGCHCRRSCCLLEQVCVCARVHACLRVYMCTCMRTRVFVRFSWEMIDFRKEWREDIILSWHKSCPSRDLRSDTLSILSRYNLQRTIIYITLLLMYSTT